jgi:penicillin-binding protein 2
MNPFERKHKQIGRFKRSRQADEWSFGTVSPNDPGLPETTNLTRRSLLVFELIVVFVLIMLLVRVGYIALAKPEYKERSINNHLRTYVTRALRGVVYDADGNILVVNDDRDDLAIIPADFPKDPLERAQTIAFLVEHAETDVETIEEALEKYAYIYSPISVASRLTADQKVDILVRFPDDANGVTVVKNFSRRYTPETTAMSHILGYVSRITAKEYELLKEDYRPQDEIGKTGIEAYYEDQLRGEDGERRITVNAQGQKIATLATSPASSGCDLKLNIPLDLQESVQNILLSHLKRGGFDSGVVVMIDPRNGAVRSIVSLPTYDNNLFSDGVRGEAEVNEYERLINDENTPFLDRAISGVFPPGSTFKIVSGSVALDHGAVAPDEYINSPGLIKVESELDPNVFYTYKDWKAEGHGYLNIVGAIEESSDTFFYQVIGGFEGRSGVGPDILAEGAHKFGFGKKLDIDLAGEVGGTVPTPKWKNDVFQVDPNWYLGDTYNFSIGQGYLLSTPLQVAVSTAVIANGGTLYRPQVVSQLLNCDEATDIQPYEIRHTVFSDEDIQYIQSGMRRAVTSDKGTAKALRYAPVAIAGKTGTAQYQNNEKEHAWFTSYAPYESPEVVITVLVVGGGEGSKVAIPIAADIYDLLYGQE